MTKEGYIRGESGLKKGLTISIAWIGAAIPIWWNNLNDPVALFLRIGQIVFFFAALGIGVFDYYTLKSTLQEQFSWRKFKRITDLSNLTVSTSIIIASFSAAVNSVLTGQFTSIVSMMIKSTLPNIPTSPATP